MLATSCATMRRVDTSAAPTPAKSTEEQLLEQAATAKMLIVGELHCADTDNQYLLSLLPALRAAGYHQLGIEIEGKYQPIIDSLVAGELSSEELQAMADEESTEGTGLQFIFDGPTVELITEAYNLGYDVIAIDKYNRDKAFIDEFPERTRSVRREGLITWKLSQYVEEGRMVVLIGAAHINGCYPLLDYPVGERLQDQHGPSIMLVDLVRWTPNVSSTFHCDPGTNERIAIHKPLSASKRDCPYH